SSKVTGFGTFVNVGPGNVIIDNNPLIPFDYTGGTIITNGATLTIGDGSTVNGAINGIVTVSSNSILNYNTSGAGTLAAPVNVANGLGGNGTVNYTDVNGSIMATPVSIISSNFTGIINVANSTSLHASDNNSGYAVGNGSTINVPANNQIWLDRSLTSYNNTFNIAGTGWPFVVAGTPRTGALRVFNNVVNGPVNLLANARIGGTINGATIQSVISGAFQLEVYGNTNSFVLVLGPTNGAPQAYSSTLITGGAIRARNSNAISSGPLVIGEGGDMQLNGFNVTVANLSSTMSASGGLIIPIEGPRVRNMNTTNAGTLTVGTDGTPSEFDGTFSDGTNAPLNLTKVGGGILTLTAVNTNSGIVTVSGGKIAMSGSGSFGKASQIVVGSGATYDVSAAGGTLTLNANQSLKGIGTVAGNLSASLGSTVAPGLPMGTLTVSGSATVNGTYQSNLNRTNAVNCSKFTASGGTTFSGATLSVTNVGPILQTGDFFQLFPGATAGFSMIQLQTNDVPNNAVYTWTSTVGSDGKITVASVATLVNLNPTNIVSRLNGSNLELSWPSDHAGWTLQSQTNSATVGISTNWVSVTGSALVHSVTNGLNRSNAAVFYRLTYP
ncbi:MAG TPA: hypothetical protein VH255_02115, partial [Verrucomicrobiae bacterium]|nr:hypothetical protein [Verrucomicrobiae bacterium]